MKIVVDYVNPDKISGILIYRRKFPKTLRPFVDGFSPRGAGRVEYKKSLQAKSLREPEAASKLLEAQEEYAALCKAAEAKMLSSRKRATGAFDTLDTATIAYLAERYRTSELAADEARRRDPEAKARSAWITDKFAEAGHEFPHVPENARWTQSMRLVHSTIRETARELRAYADDEVILDAWGDLALKMASEAGFEIATGGASHRQLTLALNDAAATAHEEALRRLDGDLVPTPAMPALPPASKAARPKQGGTTLPALFEKYAEVGGRHPKTVAQWRPYILHLSRFVEGKTVEELTHDDLVAWRNQLRDHETYRSKPLSAKTINGSYMGAVSALLAWAKGEALIARNPALEVTKVKAPATPVTRSKEFTKDEVQTILTASLAIRIEDGKGNHLRYAKRWLPWLMAYSGARVNELTQLRREDVFERDGTWVIRITPEAGTVKTKEYRLVPIHSHLVEQGFVAFVLDQPAGALFYDPSRRRTDKALNTQASSLGSKLAAWVRSLGIDMGVKANHAWRHYFSSYGVRHGMEPTISDVITGHASSTVKQKTYLAGLREQVDLLAREIEKLPRHMETSTKQ